MNIFYCLLKFFFFICRGPKGIQLMSNPASSVAKGRGRGRKELSASERVNQWVNQREAKRLNKERWTSRDSGDSSPIGERRHGSDYQVSSTQGASEEDSSLDRWVLCLCRVFENGVDDEFKNFL